MDDRILEAFAFGKIQECKNIKLKLDEHNISWDEFLEWVEDMSKRVIPAPNPRIPATPETVLKRKCPECDNYVGLFEVNNHPSTMVDEGYKTQWSCKWCGWDEYSRNNILQEAEPYIETMEVRYIPLSAKDRKKERRRAEQEPCNGCGGK